MDEKKEQDLLKNLDIMNTVETELNKQQNDAVVSLVTFLCSTSIWVLLVALWEKLNKPIAPGQMTVGVEIIASFMLLFILKFTRLDIRKMGVTKKGLKETLIRDAIISVTIIAILVIVKILLFPNKPIIWSRFTPFYILTSILQEFLARGFLVSCLLSIIRFKRAKHIVVLTSSLLFTTLHLYYGFNYMVGAGVLSVLLGYVYIKDRNIWGVSLIHFVLGSACEILGIV